MKRVLDLLVYFFTISITMNAWDRIATGPIFDYFIKNNALGKAEQFAFRIHLIGIVAIVVIGFSAQICYIIRKYDISDLFIDEEDHGKHKQ